MCISAFTYPQSSADNKARDSKQCPILDVLVHIYYTYIIIFGQEYTVEMNKQPGPKHTWNPQTKSSVYWHNHWDDYVKVFPIFFPSSLSAGNLEMRTQDQKMSLSLGHRILICSSVSSQGSNPDSLQQPFGCFTLAASERRLIWSDWFNQAIFKLSVPLLEPCHCITAGVM